MQPCCEVCRSFRPELCAQDPPPKLFTVELGRRSVALCTTHFYLWRCAKVSTFEGFRKLFHESNGRRSFISRRLSVELPRSAADRRRGSAGRRAGDHDLN